MKEFNVGDWVYAGDYIYGQIVQIDDDGCVHVEYITGTGGGCLPFDFDDLKIAKAPTVLRTLPQYHFDRDKFCKVFFEVFTSDESTEIFTLCGIHKHLDDFSLFRCEDEFYILHRDSGIMINWYKHLGRTNTCNRPDFTVDDLREFWQKLREELVWYGLIKDETLRKKIYDEFYGED